MGASNCSNDNGQDIVDAIEGGDTMVKVTVNES